MGSYAECWASNFDVDCTKNDVDPSLMRLFRATDKKVITSSNENLPKQLIRWADYRERGKDVNVVFYSAPLSVIKDRLELLGYSLESAKEAYVLYLEGEISRNEEWTENYDDIFKPTLEILREMNLDKWLSVLKEIYNQGLIQNKYDTEDYNKTLLSYMLQKDWYGFPGGNIYVLLRLWLEVIPKDESLVYDVTDLILSGYFELDEDFVEYTTNISSQEYYDIGKSIIITEGKSDTFVLSESLNLLYPHLADYFSFMDFDGAKVGGGAGSLTNMVKSFSGAGIINKVIAVFDNDTAAHAALRGLEKAKISSNIKIYILPDIEFLKNYPTIGPSGMMNMNINGLAGSIEPYFGKDCLLDSEGNYYPIQWTGFDAGLAKYQGEITAKNIIQKNFEKKLRHCIEDSSLVEDYDWSGIRAILEGIFKIFHEDDGQQILSWAKEYDE